MFLGLRLIRSFGRHHPGAVARPKAGELYNHRLSTVRPPESDRPSVPASANGGLVARDKNTYAKHQRETLKRQKAEAKQVRRRKRKERPDITGTGPASGDVAGP